MEARKSTPAGSPGSGTGRRSDKGHRDRFLVLTGGDRVPELERFFRSIAKQTWAGRIRVIFVDQAGTDLPGSIVFPATTEILHIEAGGRLPLSAARNLALPRIDADIIGFPDDDCWYAPELLDQVIKRFGDQPKVDGMSLRVFDPERGLAYGKRPGGVTGAIHYGNIFRLPTSVGLFVRRSALEAAGARLTKTWERELRLAAGRRPNSSDGYSTPAPSFSTRETWTSFIHARSTGRVTSRSSDATGAGSGTSTVGWYAEGDGRSSRLPPRWWYARQADGSGESRTRLTGRSTARGLGGFSRALSRDFGARGDRNRRDHLLPATARRCERLQSGD